MPFGYYNDEIAMMLLPTFIFDTIKIILDIDNFSEFLICFND
jgi:hypothetical protein